jgi:ankyrin repeat protein
MGLSNPMSSTPLKEQDAEKARELAKPIYEIINRLCQPPTADELAEIKGLIDQGADLEVRYNDGNQETLLHIALCREYFAAAIFLMREGADVNARSCQECTPYIFAGLKGNVEIMKAMYDFGNAPDHPDRDYYVFNDENITALMSAARFDHRDAAEFLITKGADMNLKIGTGKSAVDYAREAGHLAIIDVMEQATMRTKAEKIAAEMRDGVGGNPIRLMKQLRLKRANQNGPG